MATRIKVGFVGLGMMGMPMASRLAGADCEVLVSDSDERRVAQFEREGKGLRLSNDVLSSLDVLITMLPNSDAVEHVLLGSEGSGYSYRLKKGATVIDMSSSEPVRSQRLGTALEHRGLTYLDAPVSGGVRRASNGTLAILVGGDAGAVAANHALLAKMGAKILHVGVAGAGHAAKALNNYVSAAALVATVEALHVGKRFGIDPSILTDVLNASTGQTNTSLNKSKQFMINRSFASGFALHLMNKDLKIAGGLAEGVSYPMKLGATCLSIWNDAAKATSPLADHTEIYRLLE